LSYYTVNDIVRLVGFNRKSLEAMWRNGKGPKRIADGNIRILKLDALIWAEERARKTTPVAAPKFQRAAEYIRMDLHLGQQALAV
jgi:hypothetical protein